MRYNLLYDKNIISFTYIDKFIKFIIIYFFYHCHGKKIILIISLIISLDYGFKILYVNKRLWIKC